MGNICRSPAAEAVFLRRLEQAGLAQHFTIDSAGTGEDPNFQYFEFRQVFDGELAAKAEGGRGKRV